MSWWASSRHIHDLDSSLITTLHTNHRCTNTPWSLPSICRNPLHHLALIPSLGCPIDYIHIHNLVFPPCLTPQLQKCASKPRKTERITSHSWRRSIAVRTLVSAGKLSPSCARLLAGRVSTLWLSRPLSVSQHGQLSHPSLRVGKWVVIHVIRYVDYGVKTQRGLTGA